MKKLFAVLTLAACVSFASAQTQPKTAAKAEEKKECKKGKTCCSKDSKEKTSATAPATSKPAAKKN
jgi:hypothetical protein